MMTSQRLNVVVGVLRVQSRQNLRIKLRYQGSDSVCGSELQSVGPQHLHTAYIT